MGADMARRRGEFKGVAAICVVSLRTPRGFKGVVPLG